MPNEITIAASLIANKDNLRFTGPTLRVTKFAMTGTHIDARTIDVTNTAADIGISADITTAGWAMFQNLNNSGTVYVELGIDSTGTFIPFAKLKNGETALLRLATNDVYAKASHADGVTLYAAVVED